MFDPDLKARFATPAHFAPTFSMPTLTQTLAAVGLLAIGIGIGAGLVPVLRNWSRQRISPRRSAPVLEIDRWANEGGSVAPPAVAKATP